MTDHKPLFLYEEVILLALKDEAGTFTGGFVEYAVASAIMAELLLAGRLDISDSRTKLVKVKDASPTGEPIIDDRMLEIAAAKQPIALENWVSKFANVYDLRHRVARRLCERGILKADQDKVLYIFTRRVYPELNHGPEAEIIKRIRTAVLGKAEEIDPRTVVLIALAKGADVLNQVISYEELRENKKRIEQIVNGDLIGKATQDVIAACQAAIVMASIMPALFATMTIN